jgi:hypothetical protein
LWAEKFSNALSGPDEWRREAMDGDLFNVRLYAWAKGGVGEKKLTTSYYFSSFIRSYLFLVHNDLFFSASIHDQASKRTAPRHELSNQVSESRITAVQ